MIRPHQIEGWGEWIGRQGFLNLNSTRTSHSSAWP